MSLLAYREVSKALNKTRGLYRRWVELQEEISTNLSKDELEWTKTELRNALRSIEWDLEDLEDTIDILFKLHSILNLYRPTLFFLYNVIRYDICISVYYSYLLID